MFLANLAVYYTLYWWVFLTGPADLNPRAIPREPIFAWTIHGGFGVALVAIAAAWTFRRRGA